MCTKSRLTHLTFDTARYWFHTGLCTYEEFAEYCYLWHTGAPKFTNLGLELANWHAKEHGLPLLEGDE